MSLTSQRRDARKAIAFSLLNETAAQSNVWSERITVFKANELPAINVVSVTVNQSNAIYDPRRLSFLVSGIVGSTATHQKISDGDLCLDELTELTEDLSEQIELCLGNLQLSGCTKYSIASSDVDFNHDGGHRIGICRFFVSIEFQEE